MSEGGGRRKGMIATGVVVALAGVAAAVVLWLGADKRLDDAVENLAPAPVGCDTTLEFDEGGTYFVFAETRGEVGEVDGDCENDEQEYDGDDTDLDIVMFDSDRGELDLDRDRGVDYDNGTSVGVSLYTVEIPEDGEYVLRVQGSDPEVVARVGPDPNGGVGLMRTGAIVAGIAGLVLGALCIALGARRRRAPSSTDTGATWTVAAHPPGFGPPSGPPEAPPTTSPPPASWGPPPPPP